MFKIKILIIFFLLFLVSINTYSEIIYNKNNLLITKYDIDQFIYKYNEFSGSKINFNDGLKKYILIINTINNIKKYNNQYLLEIDKFIEKKYKTFANDEISLNILRFSQIKNDFIIEYFKNDFTDKDLLNILKNNDFKFTYSDNNCITIDGFVNYTNFNGLEKIILEKIKNPNIKSSITINSKNYEICFEEKQLTNLESLIFIFIDQKIKKNFDIFIYENFKKQN